MSLIPFWDILGSTLYRIPYGPARKRTVPLEVICVGFPRSGTESIQSALLHLGYKYTHHGWDIIFESPTYMRNWVDLARKKWNGAQIPGQVLKISREDFDPLIGHCMAITDAAGSVFAAESIEAYPEAKIILNTRTDCDKWQTSINNTLCTGESWTNVFLAAFSAQAFWTYHVYAHYL